MSITELKIGMIRMRKDACLQPVLTYDSKLFCPLTKALLAQQKCADPAVSGRGQRAFIGGPLMGELGAVAPLFVIFLIGLIGAAQSVWVIVWNSAVHFYGCIWTIFINFNVSGVDPLTWIFAVGGDAGGGVVGFRIFIAIFYWVRRTWPD